MKTGTTLAALLAATAMLAACSGEAPAEPLTNEEAALELFAQTVGKTPTELAVMIAANYYPTFEMVSGLGGDTTKEWDEARFKAELETAFEPLSGEVNAAFARYVAGEMSEGEGQQTLDLLAEGKNAEYASCVFNTDDDGGGNRLETCGETIGIEPSQELQDALGTMANRLGGALQNEPLVDVAIGYATCKVLAKFGKEASTGAVSVDLSTNEVGIGAVKKPCPEYDTLAAEQFEGEIAPNFPQQPEE